MQVKTFQDKKKKRPVKKLSQYDTDGHLIRTYSSILDAAAKTGFSHNMLSQVANGYFLHCGGWLWKFGTRKKIKAVKFPYRHVRRVAQYAPDGKLVRRYFSITEAEKITGFDDIGIRDAALKKRPFYKNFIWKFVD
ncbi:MAG TPA: NUMOD1 domain-containing DNA-binding protein [Chitinophagaceae bacterium]|nr:NUMOD1 domain-containing DNA-binding protein [Chitinophagaceae bacterium]